MVIDPTAHGLRWLLVLCTTWSAAHRNAENLLILRDNPVLAEAYLANWGAPPRARNAGRP